MVNQPTQGLRSTEEQRQQVNELLGAAQRMIRAVATNPQRGLAITDVYVFQKSWNAALPALRVVTTDLGVTFYDRALVLDGKYGEQTALAIRAFVTVEPPRSPEGMPSYYTSNKTMVDNMYPVASLTGEPEVSPPPPPPIVPMPGGETIVPGPETYITAQAEQRPFPWKWLVGGTVLAAAAIFIYYKAVKK